MIKIIAKDNLNIGNLMEIFENLLQNYSTDFVDIAHKYSLGCVIKICSNGGATCIFGEIIAKDNMNIANLMQTFENLLLQTTQENSFILRKNSPLVCFIKVCSNGGATYTWVCHA